MTSMAPFTSTASTGAGLTPQRRGWHALPFSRAAGYYAAIR